MQGSLETDVHDWIDVDNKIRTCAETIKELRLEKQKIENNIVSYADSKNINNLSIKTNDGILKLIECKHTSQLTFKYLEKCLHEIISDERQVENIINYVKCKREITEIKSIKKYIK